MRPSIEELATLTAVVAAGSVTGAAARLRCPKSVVSKRLRQLEAHMGTSLFRRDARRIVPTEAGLFAYERALAILPLIDAFADDLPGLAGSLTGVIRVTAPMSFGARYLHPLIAQYMKLHPAMQVCMDLDDRIINLSSGQYDLAFRIGRLPDSSIRARRIASSCRAIYCSPEYAASSGLPQTIGALAEHACLGYGNSSSQHVWSFEPAGGGEVQSLSLPSRLVTNSGDWLLQAAIAGLGVAALPSFLACEAEISGQLIRIPLQGWKLADDIIYAVYPETVALPTKVRVLIEHVADAMRLPLPWDT